MPGGTHRNTQQKNPGWYLQAARTMRSSSPPCMKRQCCGQRAQYWYREVDGSILKAPAQ